MEQIRSGELLQNDPHDRNIESKYMYTIHIFLSLFFMTKASIIYFTCMLAIKSSDETETETEAWNEETAMSTTTVPTEPFYMV